MKQAIHGRWNNWVLDASRNTRGSLRNDKDSRFAILFRPYWRGCPWFFRIGGKVLKIPSANIFEAVLIELRAAATDLAKSADVAVSRMVLRSILTAAISGQEKPSMPQKRFEQASILECELEHVGQENTLT